MKECLRHAAPFDFAALRTFIGALSLFVLLIYKRTPLRPKAIPITLIIGLLSTTGGIGFVTWAMSMGAVGKTAILTYFMPFWALLLAWPLLSEKIRGIQWPAVILAFSGLIIILEPWKMESPAAGSILAVLSGITWAVSTMAIKITRRKIAFDLVSLTAWQMLLGSLPLVILAILIPAPKIQWSFGFIVGLLYSAVISQGIALLLWFYILQELPAGTASMGTLSTPVIGMAAAYVQLGERPSTWEGMGMLLILLGLSVLALQGFIQFRDIFHILKRR